jgi:ATP-dependent RNA helicase HelY
MFTFEPRRADPEEVRLVGVVADRYSRIEAVWKVVTEIEAQRRVPATRNPESGFAPQAYGWVAGADLEEIFGDDNFAAGDFVRNCRQLLDLMRQIRDAFPSLSAVAGAAISSTDRGIVATGGRA